MFISPTEAVNKYAVSKPTIYKDMNDGTLSFKIDEKKRRRIDVSELDRLYELRPGAVFEDTSNTVKGNVQAPYSNVSTSNLPDSERIELAVLRERVATLESEREREREQLSGQIETLKSSLEQALESQRSLTHTITDQTQTIDQLRDIQIKRKPGFLARLFGA